MARVPRPEHIRARLIVNPFARNGDRLPDLLEAEAFLRDCGWEVERVNSQYPEHTRELAREAVARGFNVVVVAGGDGSIGQAADGLAGTEVALGIIPAGTGNILARDMGLPVPAPWYPNAFVDAARLLVDADWYRIDLGAVEDERGKRRRFINWCGAGLDAAVTLRVEPFPEEKRRWGVAAYLLPAVQEVFTYESPRWRVRVDGRLYEGRYYLVVISNSQLYAGVVRMAPEARMDDGFLDVSMIHAETVQDFLAKLPMFAVFRKPVGEDIAVYRARDLYIEADPPQPVHLDGDPVTKTPVHVWVEPQAVTLMVPSGRRLPVHLLAHAAIHRRHQTLTELIRWPLSVLGPSPN